jgi:hypothetical protein
MQVKTSSGRDPILGVGEFHFEITSVKDGLTKNKDPKVTLGLIVLGGPKAGKRVNHSIVFFPEGHQMRWTASQFMAAIGIPKDEETDEYASDTADWVGKKFTAGVEEGEYNGEPQNKILRVKKYAGEDAPF